MAFNQRIGRAVLELSVDGSSFTRGTEDAKRSVQSMAREIAQHKRAIERETVQFSGRNQLIEANRLAQAVQRVGGAHKLTAAEQAKVNAQLTNAIDKYRVLGREAPKHLIEVEKATRRVDNATTKMAAGMAAMGQMGRKSFENKQASDQMIAGMSQAGRAASTYQTKATLAGQATQFLNARMVAVGAFAGTFAANLAYRAVSGLAAMGREAFTSASRIVDLSKETGLSMRTIQEMSHVAREGGKDLGSFTNASFELTKRLAGGGDSVRAAVRDLGLDWEKLRKATQGEQWNTTIRALGQVQDKTEQVRLGTELHGKTFRDVSGSVTDGYARIASAARVSTDEQLLALDILAKEWDRIYAGMEQTTQATLANVVLAFREFGRTNWTELFKIGVQGALTVGGPMNAIGEVLALRGGARAMADAKAREAAQAKERELQKQTQTQADYVKQLAATEAELKNLDAAERKQIAAAKDLGADTEVLIDMLIRFGVSSANADGALRLLNDSTKSSGKAANTAAKDWQNFIDQWTAVAKRTTAMDLGKAIATGQIKLAQLTKEQQQAIMKALQEGAEAWVAWANVVPAQVSKALGSVELLRLMREELEALHQVPFGAAIPEGSAAAAQRDIDRTFGDSEAFFGAQRTRLDAERDFSTSMQELALSRTEFAIKQAEREGASRVQLLQMEEALARQKYDVERAAADRAFEVATRDLQRTTVEGAAEYDRQFLIYEAHLAKVNEAHAQASEERRAEMRRETDFWLSELGRRLKDEARGAAHQLTGRLVSTFFSGGDGSARREAEAARDHYERIRRSGTASAEEITRAYMAMRDAQNRAGSQWADRFKSIFDGVKRHIFNIFDLILQRFINKLLKGMIDGLLGSSLAQKFGNWLGGALGGGSGGGGVFGQAAQFGLGQLLGGGAGIATTAFSTTAGGTLAASMIAPSVASAAVPAAIASQGVSAAVAAGAVGSTAAVGTATGAGAAGAAGTAGGGVLGITAGGLGTAAAIGGAFAVPLLAAYLLGAFKPSGFQRIQAARDLLRRGVPESKWPDWITDDKEVMRRVREGRAFDHYGGFAFGGQVGFGDDAGLRRNTFHTGGVVGVGRSSIGMPTAGTSFVNRLNSSEVLATLLKGEGVLTPRATAAIGGKAGIDALNRGAFTSRLNQPQPRWTMPAIRIPDIRPRLTMPTVPPKGGGGGVSLPAVTSHHVTFNVNAIDAQGVDELFDKKLIPRLKRELTFDRSGLVPSLKNAVLR